MLRGTQRMDKSRGRRLRVVELMSERSTSGETKDIVGARGSEMVFAMSIGAVASEGYQIPKRMVGYGEIKMMF
jgi:hypothetical protein